MNITEVKKLLELYYDGESTETQENVLREWFAGAEAVPPELEADRRMFAALDAAGLPEGLERRMEARIDSLAAGKHAKSPRPGRRLTLWLGGAAACAVIATCGLTFFRPRQTGREPELTRQEATLLAENSLRLLAQTLDRGADNAATAGLTLGETTRKTIETLNNIETK